MRSSEIGGQAVIEGVMMKSKTTVALSVRQQDGNIFTETSPSKTIKTKFPFLGAPILRGIVNFIESMILSFKTLSRSADLLGIEEEPSKFEVFLEKKLGKSAAAIASVVGTVLGLAMSVVLFMYFPALISDLFDNIYYHPVLKSAIEGIIKLVIFILYIYLVGLIPDMRRVFEYHGAEHKSIFCYENGLELNIENVKKQSRFHPRCGTSFMFVMIFIGIVSSIFYITLPRLLRVLVKILLLPIVVGIGYEFIKFSGTKNNVITKILTIPGLLVQRLTTKEPSEEQIQVAIASLKASLPEEFGVKEDENI